MGTSTVAWQHRAMRAPEDPYPDALARIINARIEGDQAAALAEMNQIRFLPPKRKAERWPAMSVIAGVYTRDRYQCRYCGERVILTAVMRLVSRLYSDLFPYHPNWKADLTHPAFVSRSATLDHVHPIADGGDPLDPANLVTACWGCNRRKGDLRLDELGWSPNRTVHPELAGSDGAVSATLGSSRSAAADRGRTRLDASGRHGEIARPAAAPCRQRLVMTQVDHARRRSATSGRSARFRRRWQRPY